ncbi:Ger(x)C family spore germination protein [Bacillus pinisoli]|uniref:Ger(x)C family spore germination protein n=1 Tax=Bacillus pinisoli TaxID=2901866 RepID=UPI001FF689F9|nr:Ger(x)C family spore germination protein [Bacillus pinisoli]
MTIRLILIILSILCLSGCVESHVIDDINIISAVGYDKSEEGKVMGTTIIPVYEADKSITNESFSAEATQSKAILRKMQQKSSDPLVNGSIEVVLFGRDKAEEGVIEIVDTLERDPNIGSNIMMAVVDGKAQEILQEQLGNRGTGTYLFNLLENNMTRRELPRSNLHLFLFSYYSKGRDPSLPYIKLEGNKVNIKGMAIFTDDKVTSYVDDSKMFFYKALMENFKNGSYTLEVDQEYATIYSLTLDRKYDIKNTMSNPKVHITVTLEGHIREYSGKRLESKSLRKIEAAFEKLIKDNCETLLNEFKDKGSDPVGIGLMAKTQTRHFDEKKWKEAYKNATFHVNAKVIISETGIVE